MNLNQIRYFQSVYECQNITKAAEELHVSQPAISSAIRDLEEELDAVLFVRHRRGLIATDAGAAFYGQACRILAQCEQAKQLVSETVERNKRVRLGMAPMSGYVVFPEIYRKLSEEYPEIELEILEKGSYELIRELEAERLDLIIIPDGVDYDNGVKKEIFRSRMVFAVNRKHPLASRDRLELRDLEGVSIAMYRKGYLHNAIIRKLLEEQHITTGTVSEVSSYSSLKMMVDCTATGGFLLREIVENDDAVKVFEFPELPELPINLVWKKGVYLTKAVRQMLFCLPQDS